MTTLDPLNLDMLLARSVLLRADYVQVQTRIRQALSGQAGDGVAAASERDFDELVTAMSRSMSADARYLCTLSLTVHGIIARAKASA